MGILALTADERVADVKFTKDSLSVALRDGRTITVPLAWYPRLFNATAAERRTGTSRVAATASIGRTSMRISVRRDYSGGHPPRVRPMSRHRGTRNGQETSTADLPPRPAWKCFASRDSSLTPIPFNEA